MEKDAKSRGGETGEERQSLTPPLNAAIISKLLVAEEEEKKLARKVLGLQVLITLIATSMVTIGWKSSPQFAIAMLGGGSVSVLNSALVAWRMTRVASYSSHNANQQLRLLYFYAAERNLAVIALLGVCLAVLKLTPLAVLSGFVLGQTVLLVARLILKIKTEI